MKNIKECPAIMMVMVMAVNDLTGSPLPIQCNRENIIHRHTDCNEPSDSSDSRVPLSGLSVNVPFPRS